MMWFKENKDFWLVQRIKLRPINEGKKEVILNTIEETKKYRALNFSTSSLSSDAPLTSS